MSTHEIESKIRELRGLQVLIAEAEEEAEAIRDTIKEHMGETEELHSGEYKVTWKNLCQTCDIVASLTQHHLHRRCNIISSVARTSLSACGHK